MSSLQFVDAPMGEAGCKTPVLAGTPDLLDENLRHELRDYLRAQVSEGQIAKAAADFALAAWKQFDAATGCQLSVPDASPAEDGNALLLWDKNEHHLEVETSAEGSVEVYYRNRKTETDFLAECSLETVISDQVRLFLRYFL